MFVVVLAVWLLAVPIAANHFACENIGLKGDDQVMSINPPFSLLLNGETINKVHVDINGAIQLGPNPILYSMQSLTRPNGDLVGCCFGDMEDGIAPDGPPQTIRVQWDDLSLYSATDYPVPAPTNIQGFGVFQSHSGAPGFRTWTLEWFAGKVNTKTLVHFTITFTEGVDGFVVLYDMVSNSKTGFIGDTQTMWAAVPKAGTKLTATFEDNRKDQLVFRSSAFNFCSPCTNECKDQHYNIPPLITCDSLKVGQCNENSFAGECGFVDVAVSSAVTFADFSVTGEVTLLLDVKFSDWNIGYVTAIEQLYDADCTDTAVVGPQACTNGVVDVKLTSFKNLPNYENFVRFGNDFSGKGGEPVAVLYPGDSLINFHHPEMGGSVLRLGKGTDKTYGQIAVRVMYFDTFEDMNIDVTLRFWTACADAVSTVSNFAGYLSSPIEAAPLTPNLDTTQIRTGRIPTPFINALIAREKVESLSVKAVGITGHNWLSEAQLWKIDSTGHRYLWATYGRDDNGVFMSNWNMKSLMTPLGDKEDMNLSPGDFLQWKCLFASTVEPELPLWSGYSHPTMIPSGTALSEYSCDIQVLFTNSRCGGALFDSTHKLPTPCDDPLFVAVSTPETVSQTHLVFDWRPSGSCSDGSQWKSHPYHCTNQLGGNKCAFCVGRANNMESRTCIERGKLGCNEMFNTPERVSFCNMEFECPAPTITFSLFVAVLLAFVGLLF